MSVYQNLQIVNNVKLSNCQNVRMSKSPNCQQCKIVKMSKCHHVRMSECQNVRMSKCQIVKLSQYQMSFIIRVCRLTQRIDCVLIFSIFFFLILTLFSLALNCIKKLEFQNTKWAIIYFNNYYYLPITNQSKYNITNCTNDKTGYQTFAT